MNVKCRLLAVSLSFVCLSVGLPIVGVAGSRQPTKKPAQEAKTPPIELFDAIEQGLVETTVIAKNSHEASAFVTNKSDAPVTVQFPPAVVAVQVLKQIGFAQRGLGNAGRPGGNTGPGGTQAQPLGAGLMQGNVGMTNGIGQNAGNGGPFGNGPGNGFPNANGPGFFSVPSQKTVQVPLTAVCLAHGKPDPRARMRYQLVKLEDYSNDPVLHETLKLFTSGATDTETAQAAVWHLTDKMSWDELHAKQIERLSLDPVPYFGEGKVDAARELVQQAEEMAKNSPRKLETARGRPE